MNSIQLMMDEHRNIERMLQVVRNACFGILQGQEIVYEDFADMINFIRTYADKHHHGKEEKFLFEEMEQRLGAMGKNLIRHGMLVEHDFGRLHMKELEKALESVQQGNEKSKLDVIAHAIGYCNLLLNHIAKEDSVVYSFGAKKLEAEVLADIDAKSEAFELEATELGLQAKYITILERMESKYLM